MTIPEPDTDTTRCADCERLLAPGERALGWCDACLLDAENPPMEVEDAGR